MADLSTTYPTSPSFSAVKFTLNTPSQTTTTNSGKVRRTGYGVSYFSWEVQYPSLTALETGTVTGYLAQTFGPQLSFEILLPHISYTRLASQTTDRVYVGSVNSGIGATNAIGAKVVNVEGAGSNEDILAAGDYFKFTNHSKVYKCVSPCTADINGDAQLFFSGSLVNEIASASSAGSISGTTLTGTGFDDSYIGRTVTGTGVTSGTYITAVTDANTATVNTSQTVTTTTLTYSVGVTITQVPFTAILAEAEQSWNVGVGGITAMSVPMREVF